MSEDSASGAKKEGFYPGKVLGAAASKAKAIRAEIKEKVLDMQQEHRLGKTQAAEREHNKFLEEEPSESGEFGLPGIERHSERGRSPTRRGAEPGEASEGAGAGAGSLEASDSPDPSAYEAGPAAVHSFAVPRAVVGNLTVSGLEVRGLAVSYQVYLTCLVERQRETSKRLERLLDGGCGAFQLGSAAPDNSWDFPITDVSGEIVLALYGKPSRGPAAMVADRFVGKVIIPLSRLYRTAGTSQLLRSGSQWELSQWLTVYPLPERNVHFEPVIEGIPGTGLQVPSGGVGALGEVRVRLRMRMHKGMSVALAAALNPPLRPAGEFEKDEFDPKHLKGGANRIKAIVRTVKSVGVMVQSVRAWDRPFVTLGCFCWFAYATLLARPWQLPALLGALYVVLSWLFPYEPPDVAPVVWNHEIVRDPDMPDTAVGKLKMIPKLLGALQRLINKVAFTLERVINALNWTDPVVSLICSAWLLLFSLSASAAWLLVATFCDLTLAPGTWLFLFGLPAFFPTVMEAVVEFRSRAVADFSAWRAGAREAAAAGSGAGSGTGTGTGVGSAATPSLARVPSLASVQSATLDSAEAAVQVNLYTAKYFFRNTVARVPDANELLHRRIAATQTSPSVP